MKIRIIRYLLAVAFITFFSCTSGNKKKDTIKKESTDHLVGTGHSDSNLLTTTLNQEDTAVNDYLAAVLKPIRSNFKKLNSITSWDSTIKKDLWETAEGGVATYFYLKGELAKIITRNYGETFQQLTEYYLLNNQLSFVFDREYKYNRPVFYDSAAMKENNDDQVFDLERSVLIEDRSYFSNGKLIHQINNQDCGSPFSKEYLLEEEKLLNANIEKLKTIGR